LDSTAYNPRDAAVGAMHLHGHSTEAFDDGQEIRDEQELAMLVLLA
jgi:hypothetical protein